jgi:hypothetical protein
MEIDPHDLPRHEVEKVGVFFTFYEFQVNSRVPLLLKSIIYFLLIDIPLSCRVPVS